MSLNFSPNLPPFGFGDEVRRLLSALSDESSTHESVSAWIPAADIYEFEDRFEIHVDLPGLSPADVEMVLEQRILTIAGERRPTHSQEQTSSVKARMERSVGRFRRRFLLPDGVDTAQVKASHRHGVLAITVPKQQKAQPRRIEIAG